MGGAASGRAAPPPRGPRGTRTRYGGGGSGSWEPLRKQVSGDRIRGDGGLGGGGCGTKSPLSPGPNVPCAPEALAVQPGRVLVEPLFGVLDCPTAAGVGVPAWLYPWGLGAGLCPLWGPLPWRRLGHSPSVQSPKCLEGREREVEAVTVALC